MLATDNWQLTTASELSQETCQKLSREPTALRVKEQGAREHQHESSRRPTRELGRRGFFFCLSNRNSNPTRRSSEFAGSPAS